MGFRLGYTIASVIAVALSLGVGGCATQAQRDYQLMATNQRATLQTYGACLSAARSSPEYGLIRRHIPADLNMVALEQLMDTQLVSEDERLAILAVHPREQACRASAMQQISATNAGMVAIITVASSQADSELIALLQKKLTWGEYVKRYKELNMTLSANLEQENARVISGLNLSHQAELNRRQAIANAIIQHAQNAQIIASMNRPVYTDCTRILNSVNCVSH
jgi:hypothetical protein